jgi:Mn-dependent DtxR family transcriptional regulator
MVEHDRWSPALDLFWEEADLADAAEHPLRRELAHRLDALVRYERMLADAQSHGHKGQISALTKQHSRQLRVIERLQDALQRHDAAASEEDATAPHRKPSS